jgi:hypothetical protein
MLMRRIALPQDKDECDSILAGRTMGDTGGYTREYFGRPCLSRQAAATRTYPASFAHG